MKDDVPNLKDYSQRLRDEANMDIADIQAEGEKEAPTKHTQIIAIYGKGGLHHNGLDQLIRVLRLLYPQKAFLLLMSQN